MKPNIFQIATSELTQDAFFTWYLQWADISNAEVDRELHLAAQSFVRLLLGQDSNYKILTVTARRQQKHVDIYVEVNDEYHIVIEDKTSASQHGNQLERYKQETLQKLENTNLQLKLVYLKSRNESENTLIKVREEGYTILTRQEILLIFKKCKSHNEIFCDFTEYIDNIEIQTNSFKNFGAVNKSWMASEGFYSALQNELTNANWRYVANRTGGFLGFWYNFISSGKYTLYIQIENSIGKSIKLVIKISDWHPSIHTLRTLLGELQRHTAHESFSLQKPKKLKAGATSTLAIVEGILPFQETNFDIHKFRNTLIPLELALKSFCDIQIASA